MLHRRKRKVKIRLCSHHGIAYQMLRKIYRLFCVRALSKRVCAIGKHNNDPKQAIGIVRDWLNSSPDVKNRIILPSGKHIYEHYCTFLNKLPDLCARFNLDKGNLVFKDYTTLVSGWLKARDKLEAKG